MLDHRPGAVIESLGFGRLSAIAEPVWRTRLGDPRREAEAEKGSSGES